ncbi:uncharacterized protein LOC113756041 [Coffea eugenioides]|uniref:uncharacterized protein LOC113756041 n=1 Tax=Coffea eugenioides TaxID=49369 RepID=UPI000F6153F0|nr:uncharacterized protein LOC113756041 [Coffea eugenioides]
MSISHLARELSNHAPLLISVSTRLDNKPRPFRFLNVWMRQDEFLPIIRESWDQSCPKSPMQILCHKLKRLRGAIQSWNKEVFGDIFQGVKKKEEEWWLAMVQMENDESEGARVVKQRRLQLVIHKVKNERGEWVESEEATGEEAVQFFEKMFTAQQTTSSPDLIQNIPKLLMGEDSVLLEQVPSKEEIRRVVFDMDGESALGSDGYTGKFFTAAWSIIGDDMARAVCSFFCRVELPRAVTVTSIVLIPKIAHTQNFSQFRPISLCNFVNKIFSRLLADRLAKV